ncbi:MAG: molecular chaperone DnaJ [Anaerolineaceae bacterium]|nr:molecular chaperone DnaJ [Anaerolineaceae bacterium]
MARDYYDVLGVQRGADSSEIKKAFRRLARQYHPDVSEDDDAEVKFKEINEAYEVLSDDNKRARYDQFGHAGVNGAAGGGYGGYGGVDINFEDIFEVFNSAFGGRASTGGRRSTVQRGGHVRVDVTVSFMEAAHGAEKEIEFHRLEVCDVCDGSGAKEGTSPVTCPDCRGTGQIRQARQTMLGSFVSMAACPRCGGRGTIITDPCNNCDGSGRRRKSVKMNVDIPAGVHDGLRIQSRGDGDAGEQGGPPGDLYIVVHVEEHDLFTRRDNDIILDFTLNMAQAALGDKVVVPTVDGDVELSIPPGTQTGKAFRLRGKGMPRLRNDGSNAGRGDQLVYVTVAVPTKLTEEQRELFEQLADTFGETIQPQQERGFFARMTDFFSGEQ